MIEHVLGTVDPPTAERVAAWPFWVLRNLRGMPVVVWDLKTSLQEYVHPIH